MEQNKKLSLKEEVDKEARKIEEQILNNPALDGMEVSDNMEKALQAEIRAYEEKHAAAQKKDTLSGKATEEFSEELMPDFPERTNDKNITYLSTEDLEALRLGREMLKQKKEGELFEVNTEYHKHLNPDSDGSKKRRIRMPRKKKLVIALVAVFVLVLGTGATSIGSKSYLKELWEKIHGQQSMEITNVKDMDSKSSEDGDEVTAYREIRSKIGVLSVRIGDKPKGMFLERYKIDEGQGRAQLFYKYKGEIIRYSVYINSADSSLGQKEEDILEDEFIVNSNKQKIKVKEYKKKNDISRYQADFEYKGIYYQIKGVIEKEQIKFILKNLLYFE